MFFTQTHSPLSLSESGKEMILQLDLDKTLDKHWNNIKKIIDEDVTDKTAYDIQQYCPEKFIGKEAVKRIKVINNHIYE